MFPSSAAMLKNLQQSAMTSPFLMENLLQSKAAPGADLTSLTLNWAASLVARQRERECEANSRHSREKLSPSSASQGDQLDQRSTSGARGTDRGNPMIECGVREQHQQRGSSGRMVDRQNDRMHVIREKEGMERGQIAYVDVDNERIDGHVIVDRLCAMERLCNERIENRSSSAVDSCNSNVDEDQIGIEMDGGLQAEREKDDGGILGGERVTALQADRRYDLGCRNVMHTSDEMTIQGEREVAVERVVDRIGERTTTACSCGDEQCLGPACRTIQEKEKPQLKFSVNAILGGNHDRRPHSGNCSNSRLVAPVLGFKVSSFRSPSDHQRQRDSSNSVENNNKSFVGKYLEEHLEGFRFNVSDAIRSLEYRRSLLDHYYRSNLNFRSRFFDDL